MESNDLEKAIKKNLLTEFGANILFNDLCLLKLVDAKKSKLHYF